MFGTVFKTVFGSRNQRLIRKLSKKVQEINALEPELYKLTDEKLQAKTQEFKDRLQKGELLDDILVEAFAVVREASNRVLKMRHFDVQLIGGMVLHQGKISEMHTGEGKTLVATLPAYLNALSGKGVHIVTVNDYLVKRDSEWMGPLYNFLGLTVGINVPGMNHAEKQEAYKKDITYGTNNEFGFDYLRDNMAFSRDQKVQRKLNYAVVDEVDSILIDEARTPLIISGPAEDSSELYIKMNEVVPKLEKQIREDGPGDYTVDEKNKQAFLTEEGHQKVEEILLKKGLIKQGDSLYDAMNISLVHHLNSALRAHVLFSKDIDYIIKNNQVVIVDEHTGRTMEGRRWSEGLHQAIEAKEGVPIENENQTLASITFQNYFRLYNKLAGMTGTADTEAYEFHQIYGLEVVVIPTNKPISRKDQKDFIYFTLSDKYKAIINDIKIRRDKNQPVLLGTASIESSELLSQALKKEKIDHKVLNAKFHAQEAEIISDAGRPGSVTIATNMAGRGTDIVLGGAVKDDDWEERHKTVIDAGGLYVIGSERHESRRIDNQLRGRSGRQGDPGETRFYLSLDDNLMRIFASPKMRGVMQNLATEGDVIESKLITRGVENAQRKVEAHNFDIRKQLLEYDNVANEQRKVVYQERDEFLGENNLHEIVLEYIEEAITLLFDQYIPPQSLEEQWDIEGLEQKLANDFGCEVHIRQILDEDHNIGQEDLLHKILENIFEKYKQKEQDLGTEALYGFEKNILLQSLDSNWKEHLVAMDHLRQGINLRGYAQKDPKQEYKREAFNLFDTFLDNFRHEVATTVLRFRVLSQAEVEAMKAEEERRAQNIEKKMTASHLLINDTESDLLPGNNQANPKVGRNDPCVCGSGKKYKSCCGKL